MKLVLFDDDGHAFDALLIDETANLADPFIRGGFLQEVVQMIRDAQKKMAE